MFISISYWLSVSEYVDNIAPRAHVTTQTNVLPPPVESKLDRQLSLLIPALKHQD